MTVGKLGVKIVADNGAAIAGMRAFRESATEGMGAAGSAVAAFRADLLAASESLQRAAGNLGKGFDAANDAIVAGSEKSVAAIEQIDAAVQNIRPPQTMGEKLAAAFGAGAGAGYVAAKTWVEKTEEYVAAKAKVIGIGLAIAAVSATAGVVYGAYRIISGTLGFIGGLFTGSSYKAESIDNLIKVNNEVKTLQTGLNLSAIEANALRDALGRLGVDPNAYVGTFAAAQQAMHANTEELDRLGIAYKDANGDLLDTQTFLGNAKKALDAYTAGWDRNQAAAAIGAGTYEQINAALKVTDAQLEQSKSRLDDYILGLGPQTQLAVSQYEQAMREFRNESKLMGEGFSRAIADTIMPALTDLAKFFTDSFPGAVRAFRYSLATVASLAYGLKTVWDVAVDSIKAGTLAIGEILTGLADATVRALVGDFEGAKAAIAAGWKRAGNAMHAGWDEIAGDAEKNRDRMLMAWGLDDRSMAIVDARRKQLADTKGKPWVPKPVEEKAATAAPTSAYANYLNELDREIQKLTQSEYAAKRMRAEQLAEKEGIKDLAAAYDKINQIQRGESARAVEELVRKLREESDVYAFQTSIIGLTALQQDKLNFAMQKRLELEREIAAARKTGKPLTEDAIAAMRKQTDEAIALGQAQRDERDKLQRMFSTGAGAAVRQYMDDAANQAKFAESLVTGTLKRAEDAFVEFAKTGKLNLSSLFSFMAEEYLRQFFRMQIASMIDPKGSFASSFSLAGIWNGITSFASGFFGHATGADYVPYDGYPALLHEGERVLTKQEARQGSGNVIHFDFSGQTLNVGQGVSRGEVANALAAQRAAIMGDVRRQVATKGYVG